MFNNAEGPCILVGDLQVFRGTEKLISLVQAKLYPIVWLEEHGLVLTVVIGLHLNSSKINGVGDFDMGLWEMQFISDHL
jgi:hypothetical protein